MWNLITCKISVGMSFLNWIKNEMIFYCISELMLAILKFRDMIKNHFKLIPYINLLNLSWIIKCLFLRNMEPLKNRTNCSPFGLNIGNKFLASKSVRTFCLFLGAIFFL